MTDLQVFDSAVVIIRTNPGKHLAIGRSKESGEVTAIGAWTAQVSRYVSCAMVGIDGKWYSLPGEILVNGVLPAIDWTRVDDLIVSICPICEDGYKAIPNGICSAPGCKFSEVLQ